MKKIFLVLGGFVLGGVGAFFATKAYYKKYYADLAQRDIDDVKETFERRHAELKKAVDDTLEYYKKAQEDDDIGDYNNEEEDSEEEDGDSEDEEDDSPQPDRASLRRTLKNDYEKIKVNYHLVSKPDAAKIAAANNPSRLTDADKTAKQEGEQQEKFVKDGRDLQSIDRTKPYLVSQAEFVGEFDHHDKFDLYYYVEDQKLCDDQEELIDNIDGIVGLDAIRLMEKDKNVWVRNEPEAADYHVIRVDKSYDEAVRGNVSTTPRARRLAALREKEGSDEE